MNVSAESTTDTSANAMNGVLRPFQIAETISLEKAATQAGITKVTARAWATKMGLGRRVGSKTLLSRVALAMFLDGDMSALKAYQSGDRSSPSVTAYFERLDIPVQPAICGIGEN